MMREPTPLEDCCAVRMCAAKWQDHSVQLPRPQPIFLLVVFVRRDQEQHWLSVPQFRFERNELDAQCFNLTGATRAVVELNDTFPNLYNEMTFTFGNLEAFVGAGCTSSAYLLKIFG